VKEEKSYEVIEVVEGAVPTDINGVYLRNGPNPKFMPSTNRNHWFDGDSMIHAFRIKNG
jgi:carotenoid cleavage dioxygenase-like enzyme